MEIARDNVLFNEQNYNMEIRNYMYNKSPGNANNMSNRPEIKNVGIYFLSSNQEMLASGQR